MNQNLQTHTCYIGTFQQVGTVPRNNVLPVGTVPTNNVLSVGTAPTNNHFDDEN